MPDSPATLESKQERVRGVLDRLAAAQPAQVRVRLYSRPGAGAGTIRGLLNPAPGAVSASTPALTSPSRPVDEAQLPPPFRADRLEWTGSLRLGEEIHVVVDAARGGYLHLFNLGTSGEARKMLPQSGGRAPIEAGRAYLASPGAGVTPFFPDGPRAEPWVEHGPCNGFPERVLAIVTTEEGPLAASRLHPAWGDHAHARSVAGSGFAAPSIEPVLSACPLSAWAWGYCEAAVAG